MKFILQKILNPIIPFWSLLVITISSTLITKNIVPTIDNRTQNDQQHILITKFNTWENRKYQSWGDCLIHINFFHFFELTSFMSLSEQATVMLALYKLLPPNHHEQKHFTFDWCTTQTNSFWYKQHHKFDYDIWLLI